MEIFCDHHSHDSDGYEDDKFLLDDENTERATPASCIKCRRHSAFANGILKLETYPTLDTAESGYVDAYSDAALLINGTRFNTDCDRFLHQDFHCHAMQLLPEDKKALNKLIIVSLLCLFFMLTELVGGYLADSLSVMTDAAHLFSDLVGFFISILSIWIGRKSPTRSMTYGYHRAEVLGALLSVIAIWLLALSFVVLAIKRLAYGEYMIEVDTMLIVASIGVIVNIIMGVVLHSVCHTHSHDFQSHQSSEENINIRAASAHVLGDLLQSVGVLVAAIIIKIFPDAKIADPICTLVFSIIVVHTTIHVAIDAIKILAEASPHTGGNISVSLLNIPGVKHVHELHIWSLSPGKNIITAHLAVDQGCDKEYILKQATALVRNYLNVMSCTIQIENYNERKIESCDQCQTGC